MKIEKTTAGNIIIKTDNDEVEHIIATDVFINKHPRNKKGVLISKTPTNQDEGEAIKVYFDEITSINGADFNGNRNDLLVELSKLFNSGGAESESGAGSLFYTPRFIVNKVSPEVVAISSTSQIIINGEFLDYVSKVSFSAPNASGAEISIASNTFDELTLDLITNVEVQNYEITIEAPNRQQEVFTIGASDIQFYTPITSGTGPELWRKTGSNNASVVLEGGYQAENTGGNGWNEHAYFGPFTSSQKLEFSFTVDRLSGASTAHCMIKMNSQNNADSTGDPRVYVAGSTIQIYAPGGSRLATPAISVGDVIDVVLLPNKYEVFKNGVSVAVYNGSVGLTNIFMNFTSYRVFQASNINVKVY